MSTRTRSLLASIGAIAAVGCVTAVAVASSTVQVAAGPPSRRDHDGS